MYAELFPCTILTNTTVQFHDIISMNKRTKVKLLFYFISFYALLNYAECQKGPFWVNVEKMDKKNLFQVDMENLALGI